MPDFSTYIPSLDAEVAQLRPYFFLTFGDRNNESKPFPRLSAFNVAELSYYTVSSKWLDRYVTYNFRPGLQ